MGVSLYDHQKEAIKKLEIGSILCGGVGSGKSRTSLAYYHERYGGQLNPFKKMKNPVPLYIITTARKRDSKEWEDELIPFLLSPDNNAYDIFPVIDSWNNIKKYISVQHAFFIFDEQRVVGSGAWTKAFYKITKKNDWILLSATPGDTWTDYIPVFVANGFYKNKTEFNDQHCIYSYKANYPKLEAYRNTGRLLRLRNKILVDMPDQRNTIQHHEDVTVNYDISAYKELMKHRINPDTDEPIENISELCYQLRKISNNSPSRLNALIDIVVKRRKVIVFYNFDYELESIKEVFKDSDFEVAEWNGHKHQPVPEGNDWVYLVQYNAGAEAWNCIKTDTIVFFSQTYSYKVLKQASGRIDRMNTPYIDLYYYHLKSKSNIDMAISRALKGKKKFNETRFASGK